MISRGILKTGLGARIGYYFISLFGKKTLGIGYSLAISELDPRPGNAEQHRARRRHHPSGDEGHRVELRLRTPKKARRAHRPLSRAGELPQQPDHIGDVHHRHRAQPAGGGHHRQSHRQRHPSELGYLGGGHAAARPCGHAADAAGTVFRQPARNQSHAQRGAVLPKSVWPSWAK